MTQTNSRSTFKLDVTLLRELGLADLPTRMANLILETMYEQLESRVGMTLATRMTQAQLDEFETFIDSNDESGALEWLASNVPDYKSVVKSELDDLKTEMSDNRVEIRGLAARTAPLEIENLVVEVFGTSDTKFALDLFVFIGNVDEVCRASSEDRMSVPGMDASRDRKIRNWCRTRSSDLAMDLPPTIVALLSETFGSIQNAAVAEDEAVLALPGIGPHRLAQLRRLATPHRRAGSRRKTASEHLSPNT